MKLTLSINFLNAWNIFNKENPQNSEPQNGPRRGLDFIALNNIKIEAERRKTQVIF